MTNALIVGQGVMLNHPEEGKTGITFVFPENIPSEKENELKENFINELNMFFIMTILDLT